MKWEQKVEVIQTGGFMSRGKLDTKEANELLMNYGSEGFELVAAVPMSDGAVGTKRIALFFKRAISND